MLALLLDEVARANLETSEADPPLRDAFEDTLTRIADGGGRDNALRYGGLTVWSVLFSLPGRDETYQVLWMHAPSGEAVVVHLGRALS